MTALSQNGYGKLVGKLVVVLVVVLMIIMRGVG